MDLYHPCHHENQVDLGYQQDQRYPVDLNLLSDRLDLLGLQNLEDQMDQDLQLHHAVLVDLVHQVNPVDQ